MAIIVSMQLRTSCFEMVVGPNGLKWQLLIIMCVVCDKKFNWTSGLENAGHEVSPQSQIAK